MFNITILEMQIKLHWDISTHPLGWLLSKWQKLTSVEENVEKGVHAHCWWECKLVQSLWKTLWRYLKKLKIELWYGQAYGYLSTEHKNTNLKRCIHFNCSIIYKLANIQKQTMSCDRWMDKEDAVYVYTIKH